MRMDGWKQCSEAAEAVATADSEFQTQQEAGMNVIIIHAERFLVWF